MINAAYKLYDKLLNIYTTQYDKLLEDVKKKISVLNRHEILTLAFHEDHLPPMLPLQSDEEVRLELEETIAQEIKH